MRRDETYFEAYTRTLGPIDRYEAMTAKQLGRRITWLQREFGAALLMVREQPDSIVGKTFVYLLEPHWEAAISAAQSR